jgi:phospholipid-binding lipoprotein MlaA
MYSYDPWEKLNRFTYRFNARFDDGVFLPVANAYRRLPQPLQLGIHDFFGNLAEIPSIVNYGLQLRWNMGARNIGRFVINTTIGIAGLLDIATKLHLPAVQTGLSATLATYGVHPGPYLVIPLLGPSTLRDGVGRLGDYSVNYVINPVNLYRGAQSYALSTLNAIDERSDVSFRYFGTGSPFEYETVRFLYVHRELIEDDALRRWHRAGPRDASAPAGK